MSIVKRTLLYESKKSSLRYAYMTKTGTINSKDAYAWVESCDKGEFLYLSSDNEDKIEVFAGKYIIDFSFNGSGIVLSACDYNGEWKLLFVNHSLELKEYMKMGKFRARNICAVNTGEIVYEKRYGKKCAVYINIDGFEKLISPEGINSYEPQICKDSKGFLVCAYTAFVKGNYHVYIITVDNKGNLLGEPFRVDDQCQLSCYPTIVSCEDGGCWVSWTLFGHVTDYTNPYLHYERTYLQHSRYRRLMEPFLSSTRVMAGYYKNDVLYAPYAPRNVAKGNSTSVAFVVGGSERGEQSKLLTLGDGTIALVYKKYKTNNSKQNICVSFLDPDGWSEPDIVVEQSFTGESISACAKGDMLNIAATEDHRLTGGGRGHWEATDNENTIAASIIQYNAPHIGAPKNELISHTFSYFMGESAKEADIICNKGDEKLVWGQTHCHTSISVCTRSLDQTMEFNYRYFQDTQNIDFAAMTDHAYNMWPLEMKQMNKEANYYYFPNEFVAIPAYEWTGQAWVHDKNVCGHVNALYFGEDGELPVFEPSDPDSAGNTFKKMFDIYRDTPVVTIPHHTADSNIYYDWDNYDPEIVLAAEVFQDHRGQFEQQGVLGSTDHKKRSGWKGSLLEALKRGYRIGFIASAEHRGKALAGVEVSQLTRTGIYNGLKSIKAYGSTCTRAYVNWSAKKENDELIFTLKVEGNSTIHHAEIVKDGNNVSIQTGGKKSKEFTYKTDLNDSFYYARVLLENGEVLWTSPIWADSVQ